MQKIYFNDQESSRYYLCKQDWTFLLVMKMKTIVYEWELQWLPSSKDNARVYIHKKQKHCETFVYTKSQTLFKKLDNRYGIFIKFLNLAFIYKKHDTFRYVTFLYKKIDTHGCLGYVGCRRDSRIDKLRIKTSVFVQKKGIFENTINCLHLFCAFWWS